MDVFTPHEPQHARAGAKCSGALPPKVAEKRVDALLLSRIQFGFVITFHILFPAFTIGLAHWLAFLEWRWLRTRDAMWRTCIFWLRIFAISFGMGGSADRHELSRHQLGGADERARRDPRPLLCTKC